MIEVSEHTEDKEKLYQKEHHPKKYLRGTRQTDGSVIPPKSKYPQIEELNKSEPAF